MKQIVAIIISIILIHCACQSDMNIDNSPNLKLQFSTDSVIFDTIFSGIGSVTKHFTVYNNSAKDVEIDRIFLAKNTHSNYNINIDGSPLKSRENVLIRSKDSMYVFVEVLVNTKEDALLVKDSVVFVTNGNSQNIKLIAWGQDVNLIDNDTVKSAHWTNRKPYLIYNSVLIDRNAILHIEAGTKIYFHKGSTMYVAGTLEIAGSFENPVILKTDRLEQDYADVPGQWQGISIMKGSKNNFINYAEIRNAFTGIQIDSSSNDNQPTLSLHNTRIAHCSYAGILAKESSMFATNCLIADCGYFTLAIKGGGQCDFYNCTFANYWQNSIRNTPSILLQNYYRNENSTIVSDIEHAGFYNCLIYGNMQNEISIDKSSKSGFINYDFENCLLKYDESSGLDAKNIQNSFNKDPLFVDIEEYKFDLDSASPAINMASRKIVNKYPKFLSMDINNVSRISDKAPDIGAFERIEK